MLHMLSFAAALGNYFTEMRPTPRDAWILLLKSKADAVRKGNKEKTPCNHFREMRPTPRDTPRLRRSPKLCAEDSFARASLPWPQSPTKKQTRPLM